MSDKYMSLRLDEECQRILTRAKMLMSEDPELLEGENPPWINNTAVITVMIKHWWHCVGEVRFND